MSKDDALMEAVNKLQEDLGNLMLEVNKKKNVINSIYEILGQKPPYEIEEESKIQQSIERDQFYGKNFVAAASEFLKMRRHACTADEIFHGLEDGGFDFPWKSNERLRMVAISLSKNTAVFHKLPNNTFGLLSFYPDIRKKTEPQNKGTKIEEKEGQEGSNFEEKDNQTEEVKE